MNAIYEATEGQPQEQSTVWEFTLCLQRGCHISSDSNLEADTAGCTDAILQHIPQPIIL